VFSSALYIRRQSFSKAGQYQGATWRPTAVNRRTHAAWVVIGERAAEFVK